VPRLALPGPERGELPFDPGDRLLPEGLEGEFRDAGTGGLRDGTPLLLVGEVVLQERVEVAVVVEDTLAASAR
jgi:hypothetical protein